MISLYSSSEIALSPLDLDIIESTFSLAFLMISNDSVTPANLLDSSFNLELI
jgi:hypothetical protein